MKKICFFILTFCLCSQNMTAETLTGTCGDNLTWSLDTETGVLTISGTGAMADYGDASWYSNSSLIKTATIGNGVTSIGMWAFSGCSGLTSITIPNSVTSIGSSAFSYCSGLTSVTLPDGVTNIGYAAFYYCTGLTSITIPNGVTSIGSSAFEECSGLTSITIPNSVTSIGGDAFYYCTSLTNLTIGNSVTSIGSSAFRDCRSLTEIYSLNPTPPNVNYSNTFDGVPKATCKLYVPEGAKAAYQVANGWREFANILEEGGSGEPEPQPEDTVTVKDSVVYNIIYKDSVVYNIITEDSIKYNITEVDSIRYNITEKDSIHYNITERDSVHYTIKEKDSIHYNITEKDSIKYNIIKVDSVVYDIIHKDSIDYTLVPDTVYIPVVTDISGAEHVVTANARVVEEGGGILIQGLEPNAEFSIYTVKGEKYATGIADAAGEYRLSAIDDGLYILFFRDKAGKGQYSKFSHQNNK